MTRPWRLALLLSLTLAGCGELNTPGEALSLFASTPDPAFIREPYTFDFVVSGGLAPYNFELRDGQLPPGLTLENGAISGTATREGNFDFTLRVSDANLSRTEEEFTLKVTTPPPAELVLNVPPTTVSDAVRIPISVQDARNLQALRTQITWDSTQFEFVEGSVRATQGSLGLLQQARPGQLSVDLSLLGPSFNGDTELFSFELSPLEPNTLTLQARTEYRSRDDVHGFSSTEESADTPDETVGDTLPSGGTDGSSAGDNGSDTGSGDGTGTTDNSNGGDETQ